MSAAPPATWTELKPAGRQARAACAGLAATRIAALRTTLGSATRDGTPMFPGPQLLIYVKPPGLPWLLAGIEPEDPA